MTEDDEIFQQMIAPDEVEHQADFLVHWPGKSVHVCSMHGVQLQNIADAMGLKLMMTHAEPGAQCENCLNELKKNGIIPPLRLGE